MVAHATRLCRRRDLAEDLVQDALVKALRFWHTFHGPPENTRAWLLRVLTNVFCNDYVSGKRRAETYEEFKHEPLPEPFEEPEMSEDLANAILALPESFQAVIVAYYVSDLSYREIAERFDVPMGTVMSRLHRARTGIAEVLGREDEAVALKRSA